ncbi:MAG: MATE family efflux transporter [Alphaproteobacteria bacterium]|nr:MATE family efflux transporter [Alphaproteobacteria bacterium]
MIQTPAQSPDTTNWNRRLFALAGPIVLANLSVPLPGIVDTAVMGHLPDPSGLAAVGLGAMIFSTLYFTFSFLRMSTIGLTAQADGRGDAAEVRIVLYRGGLIAVALAVVMILFQAPIGRYAFQLTDATDTVQSLGLSYFNVRIWGAPAALLNLVVLGWMFGFGSMRLPVTIQIVTNLINVVLDFVFVFGFDWGIEGVALATVVGELVGAALGLYFIVRRLRHLGQRLLPDWVSVLEPTGLKRLFGVNRDLLIRTFCLLIAFAHFKIAGAELGTVTLAANLVLLIFLDISSYGLDAFANAAEILIGKAVGQGNRATFVTVTRLSLLWGGFVAIIAVFVFLLYGNAIVGIMTDQMPVREESSNFMLWAAFLPITAVWAFVLDGIFVGATRSAALRNGMVISIALYFISEWLLTQKFGNDGLWAALHIFLIARGLTLAIQVPALIRSIATDPPAHAEAVR